MKKKYYFGIVFILISGIVMAQSPQIDLPLILSNDAGEMLELHFGLDRSATDTLDKSLGEQELPPFPPTEVLEARFIGDDIFLPKLGLGTYSDYRMGEANFEGTKTHELKFQFGAGSKIIFKWNLPKGITGLLQDFLGSVIVNKHMSGCDTLEVTNRALMTLQMIINYTGVPLAPKLVSPKNDSSNIYLNPILIWQTSKTADFYRLQLATEVDFSSIVIDVNGIADTLFEINELEKYTLYYWRVNATSTKGTSDWSDAWHFVTGEVTPVLQFENSTALEFNLSQNYPNPFNPTTVINYALPNAGHVRIAVYDVLGRKITDLVDAEMPAGYYQVEFNNRNCPSGLYFYVMEAGDFREVRKMNILK